jgi:hypothetical protein
VTLHSPAVAILSDASRPGSTRCVRADIDAPSCGPSSVARPAEVIARYLLAGQPVPD